MTLVRDSVFLAAALLCTYCAFVEAASRTLGRLRQVRSD